jgi:hypothetical protein
MAKHQSGMALVMFLRMRTLSALRWILEAITLPAKSSGNKDAPFYAFNEQWASTLKPSLQRASEGGCTYF